MAKFNINTRQGRESRRFNYSQFNQYTLQPNTASFVAARRKMKQKRKSK